MSDDDIAELKKEIAKVTGYLPVSSNRRYLQIRLAQVKREQESGKRTRTAGKVRTAHPGRPIGDEASSTINVSLGVKRRKLAEKVALRSSVTLSQLIRKALDEYAVRAGYGADVERIRNKEDSNA